MTKLAGILNLTPDSFSDGGLYSDAASMRAACMRMYVAGASLIDVGAESTRPGAVPVSAAEEWERLRPFAEEVLPACLAKGIIISADTRHAENAARMLQRGAAWINDVSGFADPAMLEAVRSSHCTLVLMHSLTVPADRGVTLPKDADPVKEILSWARAAIRRLAAAGIAEERLVLDPGLGFGKTHEQSLALVRRVHELRAPGLPLYIGHSRKGFLAQVSGDRDAATLAVSTHLIGAGVEYLRVHDVENHVALRALQMA